MHYTSKKYFLNLNKKTRTYFLENNSKIGFEEAEEHLVVIDPEISGGQLSPFFAKVHEITADKLIQENQIYETLLNDYKRQFEIIFE